MSGEAPAVEKVISRIADATISFLNTSRRTEKDKLFHTDEDFTRADPSKKRLVVIGCTGSGKSTLLNVLGGWRYVQSADTDFQFVWQKRGTGEDASEAIFESAASSDSVTKKSSFANLNYRGDPEREIIVMDTPGHDDPAGCEIDSQEARDVLGGIAADLHNKLKAFGTIHAILVLHNDPVSNRLNPATYQILKMVDEKFAKAGTSVWKHVVIGYSKCNSFETSWRSGLEGKKKALQAVIKEKIKGCEVDLPVLALGGGEIDPAPPSHGESDGLEKLWEFVAGAEGLDTSELQPFEGADVKWHKMVAERDEAEAKAKAALSHLSTSFSLNPYVGANGCWCCDRRDGWCRHLHAVRRAVGRERAGSQGEGPQAHAHQRRPHARPQQQEARVAPVWKYGRLH